MKKINKILSIMLFLSITSPTLALYDYNLNNGTPKTYETVIWHNNSAVGSYVSANLSFYNPYLDNPKAIFHLKNINCSVNSNLEVYSTKFKLILEKAYDGINNINSNNIYLSEANFFYGNNPANEKIFIYRYSDNSSKPFYNGITIFSCLFSGVEYINGLPTSPNTPNTPNTPNIEKNIFIDIQNYILAIFSGFLAVLVVLIPLYYGFKASKYFLTNKLNFLFFNKKKND